MIEVNSTLTNTHLPDSTILPILDDYIELQRTNYEIFQKLSPGIQTQITNNALNKMNENQESDNIIKDIVISDSRIHFQATDAKNKKRIVPLCIISPLIQVHASGDI